MDNDGPEMHGLYSFAVITDDRELLLAASSEEEKYKWMEVRFKMVERHESKVTDFFPPLAPVLVYLSALRQDNSYAV